MTGFVKCILFRRAILFFIISFGLLFQCFGQRLKSTEKIEILDQINNLRKAHLNSDRVLANKIYHENLELISQSGKIYNKEQAVENIKNTFEFYENSDISFQKISNKIVLTNYINERKYKDFPKGKFRLNVVWKKVKRKWKIISMQSSRMKEVTQ